MKLSDDPRFLALANTQLIDTDFFGLNNLNLNKLADFYQSYFSYINKLIANPNVKPEVFLALKSIRKANDNLKVLLKNKNELDHAASSKLLLSSSKAIITTLFGSDKVEDILDADFLTSKIEDEEKEMNFRCNF